MEESFFRFLNGCSITGLDIFSGVFFAELGAGAAFLTGLIAFLKAEVAELLLVAAGFGSGRAHQSADLLLEPRQAIAACGWACYLPRCIGLCLSRHGAARDILWQTASTDLFVARGGSRHDAVVDGGRQPGA